MKLGTLRSGALVWVGVLITCWPAADRAAAVTLEDCVVTALQASPDVEETAHRIEEANAAADEARAAYYPLLYTSANYTRTDNPPQAFMMTLNQRQLDFEGDFNHPDDTENLRLTMGLKYLVTDAGQRRLTHRIARRGGTAAEAGRRATANELIYTVTQGYYGVLQTRALVKVQEERVGNLEESLRVARERFEAGSAFRTDVLNLEVQLAQAREDLIRAENGVELAVAALNTAIGEPLVSPDDVPGLSAGEGQVSQGEDIEAIDTHPALAARRAQTEMAELGHSKSRRTYAPSLYLFGTADWDSDLSSDFENSYFAGVSAEWDLFTGFSRGASVRRNEARLRAARAREEAVRNNLEYGFTRARLALEDAEERLEVTAKSVESAEEALRITRERFEQGAVDITELLTAQFGLTETRTREVTARYDYLAALSNLERARGTLVEAYEEHLP